MNASFNLFGIDVHPGFFSIAMFALFFWELTTFWLGLNSSLWPWVKGHMEEISYPEGEDDDGRACYTVNVRYSYIVRGRSYQGSRLMFMPQSCTDMEDAKRNVKGYYVGKIYRVYYDRNNPRESVLKPGVDGAYGAYMLVMLAFAVLPLLFIE